MADLLTVKRMLPPGSIPDSAIQQALVDAPAFMRKHGVPHSNCDYDLMERLMVCHILYMQGFQKNILSKAVDDVSASFSDINMADTKGMSPYLLMYHSLLETSDFVVSP